MYNNHENSQYTNAEQFSKNQRLSRMSKDAKIIIKNEQISNNTPEINKFNFTDLYQTDSIKKDNKKVEKIKNEYQTKIISELNNSEQKIIEEKNNIKKAENKIIISCINDSSYKWFGDNAHAVCTSDYDEIFTEIDTIIEFDNIKNEETTCIGIVLKSKLSDADLVLDHDTQDKKKNDNQEDYSEIKYFTSPITNKNKRLDKIIKVATSLTEENSTELLSLFTQILNVKNNKDEDTEIVYKIKECKHKDIFISEILEQLYIKNDNLTSKKIDTTYIEDLIDIFLDMQK